MQTSLTPTKSVRLAICSAGELFGGVERHLVGMCSWLLNGGQVPLVVLFNEGELSAQLRAMGLEPVIVQDRGLLDPSIPFRLAKLFRDRNINIVHVHGYKSVIYCSGARQRYRFAMVRTIHGLEESKKNISVSSLKSKIYCWLDRKAGKMAGAYNTYVTRDLHDHWETSENIPYSQTIPNGIEPLDQSSFPRPGDLSTDSLHMAAVGRITHIKGLGTALRSLAMVDPRHNLILNIIGTGPQEAELKSLATELGLEDRVRFLGFKRNIFDYMAHINALVMPSLHEGLPYTVLEAMSLERPIIASSVGGLPEVIEDRVTGRLLSFNDTSAWAEAFTELATQSGEYSTWGKNAGIEQRRKYTQEITGNLMWNLYQNILGQ